MPRRSPRTPKLPPKPRKKRPSQETKLEIRPQGHLNKSNPGNKLLEVFWAGGTLTRAQAMKAKCAECMNYYADGRADCKVTHCPLYPFMPYGSAPNPIKRQRKRKENP